MAKRKSSSKKSSKRRSTPAKRVRAAKAVARKAKRKVKKVASRAAKAAKRATQGKTRATKKVTKTAKKAAKKTTARKAAKSRRAAKSPSARGASKPKARAAAASKPKARAAAASKPKARAAAARKPKAVPQSTKKAPREVPKVSPLRGTSVDDFQKKLGSWQREVMAELRQLVKSAAPNAQESIKWGQPVFDEGGPIAYFRPAAKHVTFGFWRGADLSAPPGVLEGSGDAMRHVKITPKTGVDRALVWGLVKQAARLNQTKGDPTRS